PIGFNIGCVRSRLYNNIICCIQRTLIIYKLINYIVSRTTGYGIYSNTCIIVRIGIGGTNKLCNYGRANCQGGNWLGYGLRSDCRTPVVRGYHNGIIGIFQSCKYRRGVRGTCRIYSDDRSIHIRDLEDIRVYTVIQHAYRDGPVRSFKTAYVGKCINSRYGRLDGRIQSMFNGFRTSGTIIGDGKGIFPYWNQFGKHTIGIRCQGTSIGEGARIGKRTGSPRLGNSDLSARIYRTIDQLGHIHVRYHFLIEGHGCRSGTGTAPLVAYDHPVLSGTQSAEYGVVGLFGSHVYKSSTIQNLQLVAIVAALSAPYTDHFDYALKNGAVFHIDLQVGGDGGRIY